MQKTVNKATTQADLISFDGQKPRTGASPLETSGGVMPPEHPGVQVIAGEDSKRNEYGFVVGNGGYWKVPVVGYAVTKENVVRLITSAKYPNGKDISIFVNGYKFRESGSEGGRWDGKYYLIDSELDIPVIRQLDSLMKERIERGTEFIDNSTDPSHLGRVYKRLADGESPLITFSMLPKITGGSSDGKYPFSLRMYKNYAFPQNREH